MVVICLPTASLTMTPQERIATPSTWNRAGSALCNAATVFGAGQSDILPDRPKQRRIVLDVHIDCFAIDSEVCHRISPD